MGKRILKRIMSLFLAVILCSTVWNVFADDDGFIKSPGPDEYELEREYVIEKNDKVQVSGDTLSFSANGSIKFDLLMPFDSDNLVLTYDKVSLISRPKVTIETDNNTYTVSLPALSTSTKVAIEETFGSNTIKFTSTKALTLNGIKFIKIDENFNEYNNSIVELTEYEDAVINSVIVKDNSTYLKSKGPLRRWSYEDIYLAPQNIDGRLYVPLKPFAEALGYYCEDYPDKSFVYVQGEFFSASLIKGKGKMEEDGKQPYEISLNVIYEDGATWVPLRAFAELTGLYVEYRDGYAVIDDRISAKRAIENEKVFSAMCEEFSKYIPKKKTTGKTYHVAQTYQASDINSGTEKYPFRTLEKAGQVAQAGDTVIIHEGTYREILAPQNNGTVYSPITFKAADGEKVTISALEPLTDFVKINHNIYIATYANDLGFGRNQLFYKGEALVEGRYPNEDTHPNYTKYPVDLPKVWPVKGNIRITQSNGGNIAYSDTDLNQLTNDYWKGGTFVTLKGEGWTLASGEITASSYGQLTLTDHKGSKSFNLGIVPNYEGAVPYYLHVYENDYGYITNHLNTLDIPGEWYAKDHKMYVIPPEGADFSKDFEIKQRQLCIDLRDRKYVTVQGINTIGGGTTISGSEAEGCVLDGGTHKYIAHHTILLDTGGWSMRAEEDNKDRESLKKGESGIVLAGKMNTVINTRIDYSSSCGITLLDRYHYVHNNVISNTAYGGGYQGGISITCDTALDDLSKVLHGGHYVTNNTIYNTGRAGLGMGNGEHGVYPSEMAYNHVYQGSITARDTGVYYEYGITGGTDKRRTQLHHNYIHDIVHNDSESAYMRYIIYHDGLVANRDTYNNVTFASHAGYEHGYGTFVQNSLYTVVRSRSNSDLGLFPGGIASLKVGDYPKGRPFFAGSYLDGSERFMTNYENMVANEKPYYPDNHTVKTSENKEIYRFNDVDIPADQYTEFMLYLKREENKEEVFFVRVNVYDKVGNLIETGEWQNSFKDTRFYTEDMYRGFALIPPIEAGKYDIEFEFVGDYTELFNMRTAEASDVYKLMFRDDMIFGGSYDDWEQGPGAEMPLDFGYNYAAHAIESGRWWPAGNCWNHTIYYKDRTVTGGDTMKVTYSTGAPYHGSTVNVYVDSLNSEPIATFVTEDSGWAATEREIPLNRPLEDGTYTFIWKFDGSAKCSTLHNYSFFNSTEN